MKTIPVLRTIAWQDPPQWMSSEALEANLEEAYQRLKLPQGRLELMTGISRRGFWDNGTAPSSIATAAAKKALEQSGTSPDQIDLLINASVCRDFLEPATASVVHSNLGLSDNCQYLDLGNACLGVVQGLHLAAGMIRSGEIKTAMVVSGENSGPLLSSTMRKFLDPVHTRKSIKGLFANLTIGSVGTAAIISAEMTDKSVAIWESSSWQCETSANHLCRGSGDIHSLTMETDSEELLKAGLPLAARTWKKTMNDWDKKREDINWIVGHQVGIAHEKAVMTAIEMTETSTMTTYEDYGNTGSSALPLTLAKLIGCGKLKTNDNIALLGIGSGLACLGAGLKAL